MTRIILEGMSTDSTGTNYVVADTEKDIPQAKRIKIWSNTPTLCGLLGKHGLEKPCECGDLEFDLGAGPVFDSPQTLFVEDGRVYHCHFGSDSDVPRLQLAIDGILAAGSFDEAYQQIEMNPHAFYHC